MKFLASFFVLCLASFVRTNESKTNPEVLELHERDLSNTLKANPFVMILYYNITSPEKNLLMQEYNKTALEMNGKFPDIQLWKINASNKSKVRLRMYNFKAPIAIHLFVHGSFTPKIYEGEETSEAIINWFIREVEETISVVSDDAGAKELINKEENVAFFFGSHDSKYYLNFLRVISTMNDRSLEFASSNVTTVAKTFKVKRNAFILFRHFDTERNVSPAPFTHKSLESFIQTHKYPEVMNVGLHGLTRFTEDKHNGVFLFLSSDEAGKNAEVIFKALATEYRGQIGFAFVEPKELEKTPFMRKFGLEKQDLPCIGIRQSSQNKEAYFLLDREITLKNVKIFLANFFQDNLRPRAKSQKIPDEEFNKDVRVVVTNTVEKIVFDKSQDVLIEIYSPHCGHCIKFEPTYSELGKKLREVPELVIAKIDGTVNDIYFHKVSGYPTVLLYKKNNKENPIKFDGDRTVELLVKFLKENTGADLSKF